MAYAMYLVNLLVKILRIHLQIRYTLNGSTNTPDQRGDRYQRASIIVAP